MDSERSLDDYQSPDELISSQNQKKNHITDVINLIQDQKFIVDQIKYAFSLIGKINNNIMMAQSEVKKMNQLLPRISALDEDAKFLETKISYIENNLPNKFNKLSILDEHNDKENMTCEVMCRDALTPLPIRRHLDFAENIPASAQKIYVHKDVKYLTQPEFSKIPGYMRGRVTYDTINSFIDKINQCIDEKYTLLHSNKSALKKRLEKDKFTMFKRQECPKTKGKLFITQEDLKIAMGGKIDKHTLNLIPMLRHTGRLQEVRDGGLVRYITITD